jgi:hypothetical protein
LLGKAHFKELVCLIVDNHFDTGELESFSHEMFKEPARTGNKDIGILCQTFKLPFKAMTTHHKADDQVGVLGKEADNLSCLCE